MPGIDYSLEVRPRLPAALSRLEDLAGNLLYSWDRQVRGLFYRIDAGQWDACGHNPKTFLRRIAQDRLDALARDTDFLLKYREVLAAFDNYLEGERAGARTENAGAGPRIGPVAYLCMEYGLHESLHIYSGGLGILAGDHCKAASDLGLEFVAVGLMYRKGYFLQSIDRDGKQQMHYRAFDLDELAVTPVRDPDEQELRVEVPFPGRTVAVRIWRVDVGRIRLYLLDTELQENRPGDREITHQLYGGDTRMRIAQELVLGVGGVRALSALGVVPAVWHVNEGHAAFSVLERCLKGVSAGLDFEAALEAAAAATVFTTHTAVPAGHDLFDHELVSEHLAALADGLGVGIERILELGHSPQNEDRFNMTALALRASRRHNGVSRVHEGVAAAMEGYVWPDIPADENPLTHVTNGVHIATFLAREWITLLDDRYPEWRRHQDDRRFWERVIGEIPDHRFWALSQSLKGEMLNDLRRWLVPQYRRNGYRRLRIESMLEAISPENTAPLVIGFARRFATYKRALLIFQDLERLERLVSDPARPLMLLFAGKAHPRDEPGQALIRRIHEIANMPAFRDRVFLIEGYDMALARKLVTGVDLWLNTPEYPLEGSGTSGQKAAINGVVNLSVLDGWWAEGFDGENGWAVAPHGTDLDPEERDRLEAEELVDLLEHQVIPAYFNTGPGGFSTDWVARSKRSMYTVLPRFSAQRMVTDYVISLYAPAAAHGRRLAAADGAAARELAGWKARVRRSWPGVGLAWIDGPPASMTTGEVLTLRVDAELNGLEPGEVALQCLLMPAEESRGEPACYRYDFEPDPGGDDGRYRLELEAPANGLFTLKVRMYPHHELLGHRFETGRMIWL